MSRHDRAMIKGAAVKEFLAWYGREVGTGRVRGLIESIDPALRERLDLTSEHFGILPSAWYHAEVIHALLDAIQADASPARRAAIVRDGARAVLDSTLKNGVYRGLFSLLMNPHRYASYAQKLWSRYYADGVMTKEELGPRNWRTTISDWSAHHPLLCDLNAASSEFIYEAMGCRDVVTRRTSCVRHGAPNCSYVVLWSA